MKKIIFRKFTLRGTTACPVGKANATYTFNYDYDLRYSEVIDAHPSNANIYYLLNRMGNRLIKLTLNSSTSYTKNTTVGRRGNLSSSYAPASSSAVRFNYPGDLRIDTALKSINK